MHIPVIGNGDITNPEQALKAFADFGVDGIMVGRAAIGNPWIFKQISHYFETGNTPSPPTINDRVDLCRKHIEMSVQWKGELLAIFEMRRHYSNYFRGIANFKPFRMRLVTAPTLAQLFSVLDEIESTKFTPDQPLRDATETGG